MLLKADRRNYADGIKLLKQMRKAALAADEEHARAFTAYVGELRDATGEADLRHDARSREATIVDLGGGTTPHRTASMSRGPRLSQAERMAFSKPPVSSTLIASTPMP